MQKLKISFDNQIFTNQKFGGISRYFVELFKEFNKRKEIDWNLLGIFSRNYYLKNDFRYLGKIQVDHWNFENSGKLINVINKLYYLFLLNKKKWETDLYHFTYYDDFYFDRLHNGIPRVVTVYDMIDEIFGGNSGTISSKKHVIENADLILAISQSTADDIQKYYAVPDDKIRVTYLASSLQPVEDSRLDGIDIPAKYILYVGLREWYKNFDGFIEAIYPLLNNDKDLFVLCAGASKFTEYESGVLSSYNISQQVIWKAIGGDDQLAWYYQNALFFIFPSKYEGFGIPILEAMNCNCPVVLSDSSSLREIAGYAGYYFDPNSIESIRKSCLEVIESESLKNDLKENGKIRRNDFSWEKTAAETLKAYKTLLNR